MDTNRKTGKGFMKGSKLVMSFYRTTKPSSTMQPYTTSSKVVKTSTHNHPQVIPTSNQNISPPAPSSVGFIVNQEQINPQANQKVSYVIPQSDGTYRKSENPYYGLVVDEGVDAKAAIYISCVQERFKLERVNSERSG